MTPPRHLLATAAAATISLLTLSACGENSIYTSGDATGTETTTITQSTSRTSDRYDYHSSTKYNGNRSTERDSYRRSYRDRDGDNHEVTPRSIQRTRTSLAPTTTTLTTTQVRPAPPDGQSDSQIYHSSAEWGWLSYPGRVIPGGLMINITQSTQCSVGWIVGREQRRFILTAGHCGNIRDQFAISDQAGNRAIIGEMVESTFIKAGGADYGLIELYSMKYVDAKHLSKRLSKAGETLPGSTNNAPAYATSATEPANLVALTLATTKPESSNSVDTSIVATPAAPSTPSLTTNSMPSASSPTANLPMPHASVPKTLVQRWNGGVSRSIGRNPGPHPSARVSMSTPTYSAVAPIRPSKPAEFVHTLSPQATSATPGPTSTTVPTKSRPVITR